MTNRNLLTTMLTAALALVAAPSWAITTQEIAEMGQAGVSDDLIITMIQNSDIVPELTPRDVINLKESGVGDAVIHAMLGQRVEKENAYEYDQAVRRQILMNFQFPVGYFDTTYSGGRSYAGSLTPIGHGSFPGISGYGVGAAPLYGFGYYPDYLRTTNPDGSELNLNLGHGGVNPGLLYEDIQFDDLWTWNFALYGTPPASRLYFRN
ncbi:MAG TPA: hypothetical protein VEI97_12750 [bacterium]|nr:hypothetical protein [bacterium]